jgi:hypothetical protein
VVCVVLIDDAIEDLHGDRVIRELDAGAADRGAGSERGGERDNKKVAYHHNKRDGDQ